VFRFLGRIFSAPRQDSFSELGSLGTHAFVVTEWQPGPTSWRPVNPGDGAAEPLRRSVNTQGPLALRGDQTLNVFQGEKVPDPVPGALTSADDLIEAYADATRSTGYPS
jgi:hypothetical protein